MSAEAEFADKLNRLEVAVIERVLDVLQFRYGLNQVTLPVMSESLMQRMRLLRGRLHHCDPNEWGFRELQATPPEKRSRRVPDVQAAQAPAQTRRQAAAAHPRPTKAKRVRGGAA